MPVLFKLFNIKHFAYVITSTGSGYAGTKYILFTINFKQFTILSAKFRCIINFIQQMEQQWLAVIYELNAHCWRPHTDFKIKNNNKSAVPLLYFTLYVLGFCLIRVKGDMGLILIGQWPQNHQTEKTTQKGHQTAFNNEYTPTLSDELFMAPKLEICEKSPTLSDLNTILKQEIWWTKINQRQPLTKVPDLGQAHKSVAVLNMFCEISNLPLYLYQWQNKYYH